MNINVNEVMKNNETFFNFSDLSKYRNAIYGVAALWIALFHGVMIPEITLNHRLIEASFELGNIGVDTFLFLSGISLYTAWGKQPKKRLKDVAVFLYKRLTRVYIPFLVVAGPTITWFCLGYRGDTNMFWHMITTMSFWTKRYEFINLWFVSAIILLYLLYPVIHKTIFYKNQGCNLRFGVILLLSVIIGYVIAVRYPDFYSNYNIVITRLPVFVLGCYCGKLVKTGMKIPLVLLLVCICVFVMCYPLYADFGLSGLARRYFGSLGGVAACFILAYFFRLLSAIKIDKVFSYFGNMSLEIYMYTIIVRSFYMNGPYFYGDYWTKYLIVLFIACGLSSLVLPFENHMIKLCNYPINKKKEKKNEQNR